jgi:hypothetical protein
MGTIVNGHCGRDFWVQFGRDMANGDVHKLEWGKAHLGINLGVAEHGHLEVGYGSPGTSLAQRLCGNSHPRGLGKIVAIDTKGQCKRGVALIDSKAYCSVVCKGFFLNWDGVTDLGMDAVTLEALDICLEAKSLVWDGKSSKNEHIWDGERLVLHG